MNDSLFNTVKYTGDTIKRTHGGRVYHLDRVAYTGSVLSWVPILGKLMDYDSPTATLKADYPKPAYWITDGFGSAKDWLVNKIGEVEFAQVEAVWLIWKWQPGILPPLSRGARLKRSVRKAWRQGPSTSVRGMRK